MAKTIIHISEIEAAKNFAELMAQVRAGTKVVIESGSQPVAVVRPATPRLRLLSETITMADAHACAATLDEGFCPRFGSRHQQSPRTIEPAPVGLILDSSVVIIAERRGDTVAQLLRNIVRTTGDQRVALSSNAA